MHQLVPRSAPAVQLDLPKPSSSALPAFPGLVSSLRLVRRQTTALADEAALLRRFTYKHKNQHKGQRWWKRIVEVDRAVSRAVDELQGWLGVFSLSADKVDAGVLTCETVCSGLLRLPRVMFLVEKNVSVLLNCANILEQLVESRAFLAFALAVVALAARLHSLFTVLFDELDKAAKTLQALVDSNGLTPALKQKVDAMPRTLRRFLTAPTQLPSRGPFPVITSSAPSPAPTGQSSGADDVGAVVARSSLSARPAASSDKTLSTATPPPLSRLSPTAPTPPPSQPLRLVEWSTKPSPASTAPSSRSATPASSSLLRFSRAPSPDTRVVSAEFKGSTPKKRPRQAEDSLAGRAHPDPVKAVKKKKKVRKGGGDEIDAIFG
ncbi:hypothetical protein Rt10032_c03g1481 [Rhodotorula toruloides]|uniref:Nucleolus and neural progenitor protein-like N-terminal domain-containing protein n=1 Tax=Rhodotorula toruloides TaxID=5286 RepID=A0A511KDI0_RHOTO|nr:hypothetical protein Rt10032_c03g1481 [Rhodotorula toruloides]